MISEDFFKVLLWDKPIDSWKMGKIIGSKHFGKSFWIKSSEVESSGIANTLTWIGGINEEQN